MTSAILDIRHGARQAGQHGVDGASDGSAVQRISVGSAKAVLLTVLGEFVFPECKPVWTSTLVQVMVATGVAEKSARQAIARAAAAGWIEGRKDGRRTSLSLTPRMERFMQNGIVRVHSMGQLPEHWDGRWLALVLALPESHRAIRPRLYRQLGWAGFGNPSAGLWVNPHAGRIDEARRVVQKFELEGIAFAFVGTSIDMGMTDQMLVEQSWDLPRVSAHYDTLLERFGKLRPQSDESRLTAHVQLVHEWQQLPFVDPGLPRELMPPDWRGYRVAHKLETLREKWAGPAHAYWKQLADAVPAR
ncbi:PaaX family transcriptional regulator C-terminal domain-containing protein [soil metagenome]